MPTVRTPLVTGGTLENYLYDIYTAGIDGTESTGSASRGYSGTPVPGPSNIFIAPGRVSFEKLLTEMGNGLYVTETMGMHNADPVTGEFSVGINGFFVENGEIKYPVHGITAAGNVMELFNGIAGIADDLKFYAGTGSPSMLISGVSVAGN
jgi:PmbA protein